MLKSKTRQLVQQRIADSKAKMATVRKLVYEGRWQEAEQEADPARLRAYLQKRKIGTMARGREAVQGSSVDFQRVAFLVTGAEVRRSVGFVEVNDPRETTLGSGFLVSPRLFLTNNHVLKDKDAARAATVVFQRELDRRGIPTPTTTFLFAPDTFFASSPEEDLDFTLVALGQRINGNAELDQLGCCPLSNAGDKHALGIPLNIIQHPQGFTKMVTVRNNLLVVRTEHTLLYETDTEVGSSGSPVFNDEWELVALHHYGEPYRAQLDGGAEKATGVNEGIRISAIVKALRDSRARLTGDEQTLLSEVLTPVQPAQQSALPQAVRRVLLSKPKSESAVPPVARTESVMSSEQPSLRIIVPLEITVSVGSPISAMPIAVTPLAATPVLTSLAEVLPERRLAKAAEAKKLDRNYSNRLGYQDQFIPKLPVPLPTLNKTLTRDIGQLRASEANAEHGELLYEHFSVVLSRSKRLAIFTATNIDGVDYLRVDRDTGEAVGGPEGETWYKDPRVSESFFLGQDFYSAWSHYFDRGHLTRRTDPTWGQPDEAERANADTFHFSNCSPQHFRFNQTAKYWQGVERYVLENGLLQDEERKRICVMQGPIFNDELDYWCDDVQVPSSFWKLVVWLGSTGPKAVGLIVDQSQLMDETRTNLGQPRDLPNVDVSQWRVSIPTIERRTGLTFAQSIKDADTVSQAVQPQVGAEAATLGVKLNGLNDLKTSSKPGTFR